jgi:hypothetical protein
LRRRSTFRKRLVVATGVAFALASAIAKRAGAQACCAGSGALTPGRLALHEDALVGVELHAATVFGSYQGAAYAPQTGGSSEYDFEEDLFGALRVFRRGQIALLLPLVETRRDDPLSTTPAGQLLGPQFGGGVGDVNLSVRYDFLFAGESHVVPGIAALAGLTAPTGKPASESNNPLAVDATGVGAWQGNFGLALEQSFGPWLLDATELFAWRAPYAAPARAGSVATDEALAPQWVTLLGVGFVFPSETAIALSASYTYEGNASIDGATSPGSAHGVALVSLSGVYPLSDRCRLQGSYFLNPPLSGFGRNQTATTGFTLTLIWSWS